MQLINLKSIARSLAVALAVAAIANVPTAKAGSVIGTETFVLDNVKIDTAALKLATTFSVSNITTASPSSGDFNLVPSGLLVDSGPESLVPSPTLFSFGNPVFGYFTATSTIDDSTNLTGKSRSIEFLGTFTAGTGWAMYGKSGISAADLVISFTQVAGPGTPVSGSFTMTTSAIPEPTSVAMLGLGLSGIISLRRFRRKTA